MKRFPTVKSPAGFLIVLILVLGLQTAHATADSFREGQGLVGFERTPGPGDGALAGGGAVAPAPAPSPALSRCASTSLCVFSRMPLIYQQSQAIKDLALQELGEYNPGLCGATSGAMLITGLLGERKAGTTGSWIEHFESLKNAEKVIQVGQGARTDFRDGGTDPKHMRTYLERLRSGVSASQNSLISDGIRIDHTNPSTSFFINRIQQTKYAFYLSMKYYEKKKNIWGTVWKEKGGHALVLNGHDRDALKIYDPWGKIYYVRLRTEHFKVNGVGLGKDRSVVTLAGERDNDWGFVENKQESGLKVAISSYIGWNLN